MILEFKEILEVVDFQEFPVFLVHLVEVDPKEIEVTLEIKVFLEWAWKVLLVHEDHLGLLGQQVLENKDHKVKEELLENKENVEFQGVLVLLVHLVIASSVMHYEEGPIVDHRRKAK